MAVPADVRATIGRREWDISLRTDSATEAARRAHDQQAVWKAEVRAARTAAKAAPIDLADARLKIGSIAWAGWLSSQFGDGQHDPRPDVLKVDKPSDDLTSPPATALRIATLRLALENGDWTQVRDFDATMTTMLRTAEVAAEPSHPQFDSLRRIVAVAWLMALEGDERDRLHRVTVARAAQLRDFDQPSSIVVPAAMTTPAPYQPQPGDRTVSDLIRAYRKVREAESGERETHKRYVHIFAALEAALGPHKVLRTITREDAREVRETLRKVPLNSGKRYKGLTLAEAIERADRDDAPRLSPNTLNAYLINLSAALNWAVSEEWIAKNPASGLKVRASTRTKRRGFLPGELTRLFGHLTQYRKHEAWKYWVPAIALYTGARLNEIVQLRKADIRRATEIDYLAISEFEADGSRLDKTLKTTSSERNVPIHKALTSAGLMELVGKGDQPLLFAALPNDTHGVAHAASKWFGRELDAIGMTDPGLVFHSFRHGWRDAAEHAGISERIAKYLGGWANNDVSAQYGNPGFLPTLCTAMDSIRFSDFNL